MNKTIQKPKSIKSKLFLSLCIVIVITIIFLIIINNIVLEAFYIYNKKDIEKNLYEQINEMYNNNESSDSIREFVKEQSSKNNLDVFIKNKETGEFIASNRVRINNLDGMKDSISYDDKKKFLRENNIIMLYLSPCSTRQFIGREREKLNIANVVLSNVPCIKIQYSLPTFFCGVLVGIHQAYILYLICSPLFHK